MMKRISVVLLTILISISGYSQKNAFKIKMKIDGMKDTPCYLINWFGNQRYYRDTANFDENGVVVFQGKEHYPGGIYGVYAKDQLLYEIVLNNEAEIEMETDTLDYISNMKVKKSEENKVFFEQLKFIMKKQKESQPLQEKLKAPSISADEKKAINKQLQAIGKEISDYRLSIIDKYPDMFVGVLFRTMKEPEIPEYKDIKNDSLRRFKQYIYLKTHYFDDVDFADPRINYTPLYHNKIEKYFKQMVVPAPDSIIKEADILIARAQANKETFKYTVHYLLSHYERSKIMGMDAVFAHIGMNYYTHDLAYWVDSAQIEKVQERASKISPLLIGKRAINLSLLDTTGNSWKSLYKVDSEYTVLVFWDPDCGHCKKEMPRLAQFCDSVKNIYDVEVFAVSSNHNEEWKKFIRDHNLDFINVAVPMEVYTDSKKATEYIIQGKTDIRSLNYHTTYDVYSTPQVYLLDKDKYIKGKKLDTKLIKEILEKEGTKKK